MNVMHADVLLTEMRYARICDKVNEGVMVLSDAFKMCSWFLMRAYLKARRKARLQEKHSAYSQLPLSFLRDPPGPAKKSAQTRTSHVPPDVLRRRSGTCYSRFFPTTTDISCTPPNSVNLSPEQAFYTTDEAILF